MWLVFSLKIDKLGVTHGHIGVKSVFLFILVRSQKLWLNKFRLCYVFLSSKY